MQWTVDQISAVVQGGLRQNTAIFVTWDDWGGWYDHVNPPEVEKWKNDGTPNAGDETVDAFGWLCESLPPLFDGGKRDLECAPNGFGARKYVGDCLSVVRLGAADGDVHDCPLARGYVRVICGTWSLIPLVHLSGPISTCTMVLIEHDAS